MPKNIVGFVMPTGYTFNLDGSTLYLAMGVLFSSQLDRNSSGFKPADYNYAGAYAYK